METGCEPKFDKEEISGYTRLLNIEQLLDKKYVIFIGGNRMAYTLFDKTEIASYTDVAALFCVAQEDNEISVFWKYQLYGNICWEYRTCTLYHCGKYDHFSYLEFENEDRINLKKLPRCISYNEVKDYLDKGFFVLLPINTKTLGYTNVSYKHNVFIAGYENDEFIVFDFWTPSFTWKYERVDCKRLFKSIDFTNKETVQMIYVFKYNEDIRGKYVVAPDWKELKNVYTQIWNSNQNEHYDNQKNAYGIVAYQALCEHLKSIEKFTLTDSQNIHVIFDHLQFTKNSLNKLFRNNKIIMNLITEYDKLISRVKRLRTVAYKYYISQRAIGKIRNFLVEEINNIEEIERIQLGHIIAANGGENNVIE